MVGDKISNLIITLKNASMVGKDSFSVTGSTLNSSILEVLKNKKFIDSYELDKKTGEITVNLKYDDNGKPAVSDVKRISKQSARIYKGYKELFPVKNGFGSSIISTPEGVISDEEAREKKVGGEVLFEIW